MRRKTREIKERIIIFSLLDFAGETNYCPFCFDTLCFSFFDSESTLGLTLSCTPVLLFRAFVPNAQTDLHITSLQ